MSQTLTTQTIQNQSLTARIGIGVLSRFGKLFVLFLKIDPPAPLSRFSRLSVEGEGRERLIKHLERHARLSVAWSRHGSPVPRCTVCHGGARARTSRSPQTPLPPPPPEAGAQRYDPLQRFFFSYLQSIDGGERLAMAFTGALSCQSPTPTRILFLVKTDEGVGWWLRRAGGRFPPSLCGTA